MNEIINIMDKGDVKRNIITQMTSPGKDLLSVHAYLLYSLSFENGIFFSDQPSIQTYPAR